MKAIFKILLWPAGIVAGLTLTRFFLTETSHAEGICMDKMVGYVFVIGPSNISKLAEKANLTDIVSLLT